jgi:hypothetical protein
MNPATKLRIPIPIWLLALLLLNFGPLIPWLGFYWDDWPVILTGRLQGAAGFWQFYQFDRPISAWTYAVTFPLLGSQPLHWHLFTLLLRWGATAAVWWTFLQVWPGHRREAAWTAALFAIYPVFTQQSISVAYSQHWTCYLLFCFSLGAMVKARHGASSSWRGAWAWTGAAMAASLLQLLTMEYFAGLELLRPVLLWFLLSQEKLSRREKIAGVLRGWLPYLLVLALFSTWRIFFLKFPGEDANSPGLFMRMFSEPASAFLRLVQIAIQDTTHLLVSVWADILAPANIDLADRFNLFSWGWAALVAAGTFLVLRRQNRSVEERRRGCWSRQALAAGSAALLLGMLPVWFTDRQIIAGAYSNRFGLAAMLGASLVVVGLFEEIIAQKVQRVILLSLLIGLAAGAHLRAANDYRWSWVSQQRFYWNLAWRAPQIQPGTAITPEGEIFRYVGIYSTAAAINLLYPPAGPPADAGSSVKLPYWFYSLGREYEYIIDDFRMGMPLGTNFRHYSFEGYSKDILVVLYLPAEHDCMEVLTAEDADAPGVPRVSALAAANTNLSRILAKPAPGYPPEEIFGPEPAHGWCYLYEKADLARQMGNWAEVAALGDRAAEEGYTPLAPSSDTAFEWLPFIEGYARRNRWQEAQEISLAAWLEDRQIDARMCSLWKDLARSLPGAEPFASEVAQKIDCPE